MSDSRRDADGLFYLPDPEEITYSVTWAAGDNDEIVETVWLEGAAGDILYPDENALTLTVDIRGLPRSEGKSTYGRLFDLRGDDRSGMYIMRSGVYSDRNRMLPESDLPEYRDCCAVLYRVWGEPLPSPPYDHRLPARQLIARAVSEVHAAIYEVKNHPAMTESVKMDTHAIAERLTAPGRRTSSDTLSTHKITDQAPGRQSRIQADINLLQALIGRGTVYGAVRGHGPALWLLVRLFQRMGTLLTVHGVTLSLHSGEVAVPDLSKSTLNMHIGDRKLEISLAWSYEENARVVTVVGRIGGGEESWVPLLRWSYPAPLIGGFPDVSPIAVPLIRLVRALIGLKSHTW